MTDKTFMCLMWGCALISFGIVVWNLFAPASIFGVLFCTLCASITVFQAADATAQLRLINAGLA